MAPPKDPTGEEGDWRSSARPRPGGPGGGGISRTFLQSVILCSLQPTQYLG